MKKNLVLGVAANYTWDNLEPFINSYRKNCPNAEMFLFINNLSDFCREQLIRNGVLIKDFPDEMKRGIPNNTRWKILSEFLDERGDDYEQIFITDTRDVIFQGDIFDRFKGCKNYLCCVTEGDDIRGRKTGNRCNYNWLVSGFGKEEADKLLDRKIICSGTVIAATREMKIFCREMWQLVMNRMNFISDQVVMNYLVWNNLLPIENLIESNVESGAVLTVALINDFVLSGDKISHVRENFPAVVHQYDRHEELAQFVESIYRNRNFQVDERFNDTRSVIEQTTCLLYADKVGAAVRLFMKKYLTNPDFSNYGGALIKLLEAILKKPLTQPLELLSLAAQNSLKNINSLTNKDLMILEKLVIGNHTLDPEFKKYITGFFHNAVFQALDANRMDDFSRFRSMLKKLET